ncbi:hypothetical protein FKL27_07340 [Klebsiella pneumoniae]|nr:hypothetical protein [Klebsiella pneumoniae]MBK2587666.1 hypothetical protein [Klebsiella pneumoniae]
MNIETVNELIASLESAGEPSIREQKFLKLAKEFRICSASLDAAIKTGNVLADQNSQLAAENAALKKSAPAPFSKLMMEALDAYHSKADDVPELAMLSAYVKLRDGLKTPATDRIVAEAEARGVEKFAAEQRGVAKRLQKRNVAVAERSISFCLDSAEEAEVFAKQLREGADK